jgi:oxygen-dependent protoporphyrinogen oxidase
MADSSELSSLELGYIALNFFGAGVFTFAGGLGALPRALAAQLDVRLGSRVLEVHEDAREVHVTAGGDDGEHTLTADACVLAVSSHDMAAMHPALAAEHREIVRGVEYVRLMPVQLALTRRPAEASLYVSLPESESPDLCSIYYEHNKHADRAPDGRGLLTLFWHDRWARAHWDDADDEIVERTAAEASRWVPELDDGPAFGHVTRWPAGVILSRPGTYSRLHRLAAARAQARRIHLAGDYFGGSTTNAALCSGERAAEHVVRALGLAASPGGARPTTTTPIEERI